MTTYVREDMMYVTVGDDPVPWDQATGGEKTGSMRFDPLVLRRVVSDKTIPLLLALTKRVGGRTEVTLEQMNMAGERTGDGLVYEGRIASVRPASYNANAAGVAQDVVTIKPFRIRRLGVHRWPAS